MPKRLGVLGLAASILTAGSALSFAQSFPPSADEAKTRLDATPRHGEWLEIEAGGGDVVNAWISFPERPDAAPVVVVIHEIFGLTDWIRAVADEAAAAGFIAIAPDLLSGKAPGGKGSEVLGQDDAVALVRGLSNEEVTRRLKAVAKHATSLPSAAPRYAVMGYCWGGSTSFRFATEAPELDAAVVYYGSSPETAALASVRAPVLGLYGGNDNRVNATIPEAEAEMKRLGKSYEHEIYPGAGHGFLRAQSGQDGANLEATKKAWPRTIAFLKAQLEE